MSKRVKATFSDSIPLEELRYVYNSYDIVGDIAILRLNGISRLHGKTITDAIMNIHRNVKTVLAQTSPVHGDFRIRKLEHIAGENKTFTVHHESDCFFSVDVEKCYFSPRLFFERMRIADQVGTGEVVVNMFAGVGCFSIIIAKHSNVQKIYSIDINPIAVQNMQENVRRNRVFGKVVPLCGDAKEIIEKKLHNIADRVLMPLPEKALEYLPYALSTLKKEGGWIHYYDFEHAKKNESQIEKVKAKVSEKLQNLDVTFVFPFSRVVRTVGPNWHQTVLDIKITSTM